jgi:hypothetical protein
MIKFNLSEKFKHEWRMREWGSFEDSKESESHVVAIINRSPKGKVVAANEEELKKISTSAFYVSSGYDDDHQIAASKAIERIYRETLIHR